MSDYRDYIAEEQGVNLFDDNTLTDKDLTVDDLYKTLKETYKKCNALSCRKCKYYDEVDCFIMFCANEIYNAGYRKSKITIK